MTPAASRTHTNGKRQFHIVPLEILATATAGSVIGPSYIPTAALLAAWQHLYERLHLWHRQHHGPAHLSQTEPFHWLMDTSAHGYQNVDAISCYSLRQCLTEALCAIFKRLAFWQTEPKMREFARCLGFTALHKPLLITARQAGQLPTWIEHCYGIRLKQSPNEFHPGAVWTHGAALQLRHSNRKHAYWTLRIEYSYRDESSSWCLKWQQNPGETLERMLDRAKDDFFSRVDWGRHHPCPDTLRWWSIAYRHRSRLQESLNTLFCDNGYRLGDWELPILDLCMGQSTAGVNAHRIDLSKSRLRTLRNWAAQTLKVRHPVS
jgi:hypothetical protein